MATAGLGLYVDDPKRVTSPDSSSSSYFQSILQNPPPLHSFDAFKKTNATYKERTTGGALVTLIVSMMIAVLVWHEAREYLYGEPDYSFSVDKGVAHELQINFDATIAMPCHFLTVDVRDAVGDRLHISNEFKKDSTTFELGQAQRLKSLKNSKQFSASRMLTDSKRSKKRQFRQTEHLVENGDACRVYGSMDVKKVTGNLHITTLGHGYLSWEHTDHALMNLTHIIHEFSFGPFFPSIVQPLDNTFEQTDAHFHIFQYFLSVVSTTYIDARRRKLQTNQYSVTDMSRTTEHGKGVPGIFFKYDIEPMSLTITERTTTLFQFLIRLAGIVGGILVCTDYGFRTFGFLYSNVAKTGSRADMNVNTPIPTSWKSPSPNSNTGNGRPYALSSAIDSHQQPFMTPSLSFQQPTTPNLGTSNGHAHAQGQVHNRSPSLSPYVPFHTPHLGYTSSTTTSTTGPTSMAGGVPGSGTSTSTSTATATGGGGARERSMTQGSSSSLNVPLHS